MPPVRGSESLRHEEFQRLANHLRCCISEHFLRALIEEKDALVGTNGDNRVFSDLQDAFESGFASAQSLLRALAFDGDCCKMSQLIDHIPLLRSGVARFARIEREGSHNLARGGKDRSGPAGP